MKQGGYYKHKDGRDLMIFVHTVKDNYNGSLAVGYLMYNIHWSSLIPRCKPLYLGQHMNNIKTEDLKNWLPYQRNQTP